MNKLTKEQEIILADRYEQKPLLPHCTRDEKGRIHTPHTDNPHRLALRELTRGLYDLQQLRIACGNRLCAQARVRLGQLPGIPADESLTPEVRKLLEDIKASYTKLGTAVAETTSAEIARAAEALDRNPDGEDDDDEEEGGSPEADKEKSTKEAKKEAKIQKRLLGAIEIQFRNIIGKPKKKTKKKDQKKGRVVELPVPEAAPVLDPDKVVEAGRMPKKKDFKGTLLISSYTELLLAASYMELHHQEKTHEARLACILEEFPIYNKFLADIKGCGILMSAVVISSLDPYRAKYPSSFVKYCGLDVVNELEEGPDPAATIPDRAPRTGAVLDEEDLANQTLPGEGRGRYAHHMEPRWYTNKKGEREIRYSLTFNPWTKTKLVGVMSVCLTKAGVRKKDPVTKDPVPPFAITEWGQIYMDYKNRLTHHQRYGTHNDGQPDLARMARHPTGEDGKKTKFLITCKARRERMALRYLVKQLLIRLHIKWRELEGLPVSLPYEEAKLGYKHGR
jgi:hypothetical protein